MCHLQFRNLFLFSPAILGFCISLVCFQPQLVCFDSARTVHVQCTHSARPQCTGWKRCKYHRKWPLGFKTKKKQVSGYFIWFHAISTDDVLFTPFAARALWRALCVHCTCTVKTHALGLLLPPALPLVVGTPSWALVLCCACCCCLSLGELVCPQLEHLCEPWCFAAACALASLSARGWNTLVSLGALLAEFG